MLNPKPTYLRDPLYLRWVARFQCMKCKIEGHTQAAHMHKYGQKSKGKKVCDTQARPLCTVGGNDCHGKLDRHEEEWTQEEIERALDMPLYELYASKADATARMLIEEF